MTTTALNTRAVIFDLDGTLLDTLKDLADCYNRILEKQGFPPHPVDAYKHFIGDGAKKCVERALPPEARIQSVINRCVELQAADYSNNWHVMTREYSGISTLLRKLEEFGIRLSVLSNKGHSFTELCVEHFFPDIDFDIVQGYMSGIPHKPDPTGAQKIAASLGINPQEIVFLGDSAMDMMTAVAANMRGIGVSWGFRTRTELLEAGASVIIDTPDQLLDHISL